MTPKILTGKVMHKRLFPIENAFSYGIYYLAFPLSRMTEMDDGLRFGVNRAAIAAFHEKDHGARDGSPLDPWARALLRDHGVAAEGDIVLVTMPRVMGHVFNPVSFWLCHDQEGGLRAALCEVNNTFGERHVYICAPSDGGPIAPDTTLVGQKVFHVSPFLERAGHYTFRFHTQGESFGAWIDYYDAEGKKKLITALTGRLVPHTRASMRAAFWRHPLVCLVALARIHMQAARLVMKGVGYIPKPPQQDNKITRAGRITNL